MKRFLSVVLAMVLVLTCAPVLPVRAQAEELVGCDALDHQWVEATCETPKTCGRCGETEGGVSHSFEQDTCSVCGLKASFCGEGAYWVLQDGVLTIDGSGAMTDYASASEAPWYGQRASVTALVIGNGITSIGDRAFYNLSNLTDVAIGSGLTAVGTYAFRGCTSLTAITIPAGVTSLKDSAFRSCTALTEVTFDGDAPEIGNYVFNDGAESLQVICYEGAAGFDASPWTNYTLIRRHVGQWVVDRQPDCSGDGSRHIDCAYCQKVITEVLPGGHDYIDGICAVCQDKQLLQSGTCGDNAQWELFGTGELIISGTGKMSDYTRSWGNTSANTPWYDYREAIKTVVIEEGITGIGNEAFYRCGNLESATIASTVTSMGTGVFYNCSSLQQIILPDGITGIGSTAFCGCSGLQSITIPGSVTTIGDSAFADCTGLTEIVIPDGVVSLGSYVFDSCTNLKSIYIPESLTAIGNMAFYDCGSLTDVYITDPSAWCNIQYETASAVPIKEKTRVHVLDAEGNEASQVVLDDSVVTIPNNAFRGAKITGIVIPDSVTVIGKQAFYNCSELKKVVLPESVTTLGNGAFYGCTNLKEVTIPDGLSDIGSQMFYRCSSLERVVLPDSVAHIGTDAFYYCSSLKCVTFAEGIIDIGSYAFDGCEKLWHVFYGGTEAQWNCVTIRTGNTPLTNAGYHCETTENITVKPEWDYCTKKALYACNICTEYCDDPSFEGAHTFVDGICSKCQLPEGMEYTTNDAKITITGYTGTATQLVIPDMVEGRPVVRIGAYTFDGCSALTQVVIPDRVTGIGSYAFRGCSGLADIDLPDNIKSIGSSAFSGCSGLTQILIPDGVTSIGGSAFFGCSGLTQIVIPDSVTSIGSAVFGDCSSLKSVTVPFVGGSKKTAADAYQYPFGYYFKKIYGYSGVNQSYYGSNAAELTSEKYDIPRSLKSVTVTGGELLYGAFYNCSMLQQIRLENVTTIEPCAFYNCGNLDAIYLPQTLTQIKEKAFDGCDITALYLTDLQAWCETYFGETKLDAVRTVYVNGEELSDYIAIPEGTAAINSGAFPWCKDGVYIFVPASVQHVGKDAFPAGAVKHIVFADTQTQWESLAEAGFAEGHPNAVYHFGASADDLFDRQWCFYDGLFCRQCNDFLVKNIKDQNHLSPGDVCAECGLLSAITYRYSNTGITVIDCDDRYYGTITIPERIDGIPVRWISYGAFNNCAGITEIAIPNSVEEIESYTFSGCTGLTGVAIPDSVTSIGQQAFYNCSSLTSITIPDSVTYIGYGAFYNCDALEEVVIGDGVTSLEPFNFGEKLKCVVLGEGITEISNYTFRDCRSLDSVTIPDSVTAIGDYAFYNCSGLTSIVIPDSVTGIGDQAFWDCSGLTSVHVGKGVTVMGSSAFWGCSNLERVYITDLKAWCEIQHTNDAFAHPPTVYGCLYLDGQPLEGGLYIPEGTTRVGACAFYEQDITSVHIPDSVTAIGESAFYHCSGLTDVAIPDSVTEIGAYAFSSCTGLESILIPEGVADLGFGAFRGCSSLKSIVIPDSVTEIPGYAFEHCSSLSSVVISDGATGIGDGAFQFCSSLASVVIPDSVTGVGMYAFSGCESLTNIMIPASVTSVGEGAFAWSSHFLYTGTQKQWDDCLADSIYLFDSDTLHVNASGDEIVTEEAELGTELHCTLCEQQVGYISAVRSVKIQTLPNKTSYFGKKDMLDVTGGTLLVQKYDGSSVTVPMAEGRVTGFDNTQAGVLTLTVSIGGKTATFEVEITTATVTFLNADGTVLSQAEYMYGDPVVVPEEPQKPAGTEDSYIFRGWGKPVTACTGDATYTAVFGPAYLPGDMNEDDRVDDADAIYLLRHTLLPSRYPVSQDTDMNADGVTDDSDAIYLLRHTLLPNRYPLPGSKKSRAAV